MPNFRERARQRLRREFLAIYPPDECVMHLRDWMTWRYNIAKFRLRYWRLEIAEQTSTKITCTILHTETPYNPPVTRIGVAFGTFKLQDERSSIVILEPDFTAYNNDFVFAIPSFEPDHYKWLADTIEGLLNNPKLGGVHGYYPVSKLRNNKKS